MFTKLLIANRGEIAIRVMRTCRAMGIATVAVYSEADSHAMHVREADEAIAIGPAPAAASYLRAERIIQAAVQSGAEAIHPGYGFLSERAHFAAACHAAGIVFIGPPAEVITRLGDKVAAKRLALQIGVPTVPGYQAQAGETPTAERLYAEAERIGCPLLIKAAAGGGGKGMRVVADLSQFADALAAARREALAAFGDDSVFLERLIERPRHVEIQILADQYDHCVHLFERDCSIQRRHQKLIEESPSPALHANVRQQMGAAAVRLAQAAGYVNAGTVEFLLAEDQQFYFLEMNTRLQVEHPVTEGVTGLDLVRLQIEIAAGAALPFQQADLMQQGHAIELRVCAEDPISFLPAAGGITDFVPPPATLARTDTGIASGDQISMYYDSLLAKLIVHAPDRQAAIQTLQAALDHTSLLGVTTNLPLLRAILAHPAFQAGDATTDFLAQYQPLSSAPAAPPIDVLATAAILQNMHEGMLVSNDPWSVGAWRHGKSGALRRYRWQRNEYAVTIEQLAHGWRAVTATETLDITSFGIVLGWISLQRGQQELRMRYVWQGELLTISWQGWEFWLEPAENLDITIISTRQLRNRHTNLEAPMPGTVIRVLVQEGASVEAHQPLLVIEAMKMEHVVVAPYAGRLQRLHVAMGDIVPRGATLAEVERSK